MTDTQTKPTAPEESAVAPPRPLDRVLGQIQDLGLQDNLIELETLGYTVLRGALDDETVEQAKSAILRRAEKVAGKPLNPETTTAADFNGMNYLPYLIFDDPVFQEILLNPGPLALVTYLLGESCVLSSMGCHFRGPGGLPLPVHADGVPDEVMSDVSFIANCNYALTPYSQETGALILFPESHKKRRQPTAHENWTFEGKSVTEVMMKGLSPQEVDMLEWNPPPGGVTMDLQPGDAAVWHGNTWHAGWRRDVPGTRMNLAAYFCRDFLSTQELRGDDRYPEVFEKWAHEPRFAQLLGENTFNGWREEGPDYTKRAARSDA